MDSDNKDKTYLMDSDNKDKTIYFRNGFRQQG